MGRKLKIIKLKVYLQGNLVGIYIKAPDGSTSFTYNRSWVDHGFPISQSLPLVTTSYKGDEARVYFENLLPDLKEVRESIASKVHANSSDHFDLLNAIGHDCVGALLFTENLSAEEAKDHPPEGEILSDKKIGNIIRNLKSYPLGMEGDKAGFRISLAGVQEKTALLYLEGKWQRPIGTTPTTHIIKPAMKFETGGLDMQTSVHNEYFCMKLCKEFGLNVAEVEIKNFDKELVLVVERFDRHLKGGIIYRRPMEDMCQALGYFSNKKYQSDKGPPISEYISVLSTSVNREKDLENFFRSLVVFFVMGAIDGHAKNYSIEYVKDGHQLAPLYDILSIFPALTDKEIRIGKYKMALSVGSKPHYKAFKISRRHFLESVKICQISEKKAEEIIADVLIKIDQEVWNNIKCSRLFDGSVKDRIISGIKIISKSFFSQLF